MFYCCILSTPQNQGIATNKQLLEGVSLIIITTHYCKGKGNGPGGARSLQCRSKQTLQHLASGCFSHHIEEQ